MKKTADNRPRNQRPPEKELLEQINELLSVLHDYIECKAKLEAQPEVVCPVVKQPTDNEQVEKDT